MVFRDLKADEIECRIGVLRANGLSLLLYKNARVDMDILDEEIGADSWQRDHKAIKDNMYCGVSIWDDNKKQWITKWDAGKESNTEAEKGEASDSFKRACVNWGIGRELYTSPFIWIPSTKCNIEQTEKGYKCNDRFKVSEIEIVNKQITKVSIINSNSGVEVFNWDIDKQVKIEPIKDRTITKDEAKNLYGLLKSKGLEDESIQDTLQKGYGIEKLEQLTATQYVEIVKKLSK